MAFFLTNTKDFGVFHLHSRYIVQILGQSHFELVSSVLALEETEPVAEPITQMAVELIKQLSLISIVEEMSVKATLFFM